MHGVKGTHLTSEKSCNALILHAYNYIMNLQDYSYT